MIKNKWIAFVLFVVLVVLFWVVLDWLFSKFIIKSAFSFSALTDLTLPIVVGAVMGYFTILRRKD